MCVCVCVFVEAESNSEKSTLTQIKKKIACISPLHLVCCGILLLASLSFLAWSRSRLSVASIILLWYGNIYI